MIMLSWEWDNKEVWFVVYSLEVIELVNKGRVLIFCILVDEAQHEWEREQMDIILNLQFIAEYGFIREWLFHILHVKDTIVSTPHKEVCLTISHRDLYNENIWRQGYD